MHSVSTWAVHHGDATAGRLAGDSGEVGEAGLVRLGERDSAETRAQTIADLLNAARVALDMDLAFLAQVVGDLQVLEHVSNPTGRIPLEAGRRTPVSGTYCAVMLRGDASQAVGDVRGHPLLGNLAVTGELGIGAYCGVPVYLPDGQLYGTLCGLDGAARPELSDAQVTVLEVISRLLGQQLAELQLEQREIEARRQALLSLIEPGRLAVLVQPITDAAAGRVVGYEALSRFQRPDGGPARPDLVFAEATGLGLGGVLERAALAAALTVLPQLPVDAYLSVNLSAATLADPGCAELLAAAPLSRLVLELTEHDVVEDYATVLRVLGGLRAAGLRLAIDDVGAGFSSLRHILRLAPDVIKLDVSLTRSVDADPARRALVAALVGFAHQLGVTLVAEGVETARERDALRGLGVRFMQGYLFGRPGPPLVAGATSVR